MMSYVPTTYIPRWNRAYWAPSQLSAPSLSAVWGACFFHVDLWWFVSRRADAKGPVPIGWWWQWKRFGIWLREADLWEANWIGRWKTLVAILLFCDVLHSFLSGTTWRSCWALPLKVVELQTGLAELSEKAMLLPLYCIWLQWSYWCRPYS